MQILSTLVGVNFRPAEAREIVKQLSFGSELELEAEPDNAYDRNAVKVLDPETQIHLGYLSRESNYETAVHLADGGSYSCKVTSFANVLKPILSIELSDETD